MESIAHQGRWARWTHFLDTREPGAALALFRIACGLVILGTISSVVVHGLVPVLWLDRAQGGFRDQPGKNWLFALLDVTPTTVWAMTAVCLGSAALLVIGCGGRCIALVALQSYLAVTGLNPDSQGADDLLLDNALWLLVLANSTATLSLDCRWRSGRWTSAVLVPAWPRYLAVFQLVLLYWATGAQKLSVAWVPGGDLSALYYILQQPSWQRWDMSWLAWVYPLTQVATLAVWCFEILAPLLLLALWYRRTADRPGWLRAAFNKLPYRGLFVAAGLAMHAGIMLLMNVEPFTGASLAFYVCLFRGEEWQALGRRWRRLGPAPAPPPGRETPPWWLQLRAALVSLHLTAILLLAFPAPPDFAANRSLWKDARAQVELAAWAERLDHLGIHTSAGELEDTLFTTTCAYLDIRNRLVRPFRAYYTYCGTYQCWQMFAGPDRAPTRLTMDIEERGQWQTVLVERDPNYPWLDSWLSHHRMRPALFNLANNPAGFQTFAGWLAEQAVRDFPKAERVRVRYVKRLTPTPEDLRAGRWPEAEPVCEAVIPLK
jgi:hypothetical protein